MAAKVVRRPGVKRAVVRLHEHLALVALVAIAVHGLALLGDHWLKPGLRGITVPFALSYRPAFTGLGIIAGYLAVLLGPELLPAPADRRPAVAEAPPRDRRGVDAVAPSTRSARAPTPGRYGCAASWSSRSPRSCTCSRCGCWLGGRRRPVVRTRKPPWPLSSPRARLAG